MADILLNLKELLMNQICLMCRQTSSNTKIQKLHTIKHRIELSDIKPSSKIDHFMWSSNIRCKYGITCPKIQQLNREMNNLCKQIEPYLIAVSECDDANTYHDILQLMRGDFPSVYSKMEKLRHAHRKATQDC